MEKTIIEAIRKVANKEQIKINLFDESKLDVSLRETGIDSLSAMNIIVGVEEELNVRLPDEDLITLKTLNQLVDAFRKQLA